MVDDCGVVVNPLLVTGQRHGALAQGLGEGLFERMVYDDEGQALSASLLDYAIPTAASILDWTLGQTVTPSPLNPLGVKGIGEAGPIGVPPTLVSAVLDALAPLGIRRSQSAAPRRKALARDPRSISNAVTHQFLPLPLTRGGPKGGAVGRRRSRGAPW